MDRDTFIAELLPSLKRALEKAYDQGAADKGAEVANVRRAVLDALGVPEPTLAAVGNMRRRPGPRSGTGKVRAPKGAVALALELVFADGLTTRQIQDAASEMDASISPKSIYNELLRQKTVYRQEGGRWYSAERNAEPPTTPPSATTLNGIAGDRGTGLSSGLGLTARGPGAPGGVGGT